MKSTKYVFLERINDKSNLALLFNEILSKLDTARIIFSPRSFDDIVEDDRTCRVFYETCLWEIYLHKTFDRLHEWKKVITEYINEFDSSWIYYTSSKRIEFINEFGGEESDYNEDGTVKTDVNSDELLGYSFIDSLISDGIRDIIQETRLDHLKNLFVSLQTDADMDMSDLFKKQTGVDLKQYHADENGNMVEMTWADKELSKVSKRDSADNTSLMLLYIHVFMQENINKLRSLDKADDNKDFFAAQLILIQEIIDLNIDFDAIRQQLTSNNPQP